MTLLEVFEGRVGYFFVGTTVCCLSDDRDASADAGERRSAWGRSGRFHRWSTAVHRMEGA